MADLKTLKLRINSIKKTQKITKAMKMVAASKLRKAREAAEESRSYSEGFKDLLLSHKGPVDSTVTARNIVCGVEKPKSILLVLVTSDRGLCGGLNANLVRFTAKKIRELEAQNYKVKVWCVGKKGYDQLKTGYADNIINNQTGYSSCPINYQGAQNLADQLVKLFYQEEADICDVIYPTFKSAIAQEITEGRLFPCEINGEAEVKEEVQFDYEPKKEELLEEIVIKNIAVQLFQAFMETFASEQGARMSAMDNAVNNCTELVKKLNLIYNRTRQAKITTELVEIISAAESI